MRRGRDYVPPEPKMVVVHWPPVLYKLSSGSPILESTSGYVFTLGSDAVTSKSAEQSWQDQLWSQRLLLWKWLKTSYKFKTNDKHKSHFFTLFSYFVFRFCFVPG